MKKMASESAKIEAFVCTVEIFNAREKIVATQSADQVKMSWSCVISMRDSLVLILDDPNLFIPHVYICGDAIVWYDHFSQPQ